MGLTTLRRSSRRGFFKGLRRLSLAVGFGFLAHAFPTLAQSQLVALQVNGPVSNRLNLVFLSEGYTTNQLGQFLVDATNTLTALLSAEPYQEYQNYFNGFAIPVASNESGSDHPNAGLYRDTYFNSNYDPDSDLLITIPPDDADTNYDHGQGKVDALLQSHLPNCQLPVLLVNDVVRGGSDGAGQIAIAANASGSSVFAIHESGHVLSNLGDEYTSAYPGFPDTEEPNTTTQTNLSLIKWNAWIDTNSTPVPTPPTAAYQEAVGLFEGAHYHPTGWYRPQLNCAMGNFSSPFCAVCREALVLAIYQHVRPVDQFTPVLTNLSASSTQLLSFDLSVLHPATHELSVQWFTNAIPVAGATNVDFQIEAGSLGSGNELVSARVWDATPMVRNDPEGRLSQTLIWNVGVGAANLLLDAPEWRTDGSFSFRVTGNAPAGFVIQSSADLACWHPVATNTLVAGEFLYTNAAADVAGQFFRAQTPP